MDDELAFGVTCDYPIVEQSDINWGEARADTRRLGIEAVRTGERAAAVKETAYQNEHHPERDDTRGVTRCKRCERLLAMDSRPEFRQLHPCSVLRG